MKHLTKIVATLGPASANIQQIRAMVNAGMAVARLNFSHGNYSDHAHTIAMLRQVSADLDVPITILQDLQGPKIRVGKLPESGIELMANEQVTLLPLAATANWSEARQIGIDYDQVAEEAEVGTQILLADGALELRVIGIKDKAVDCQVIKGGTLTSHKGVNFPNLNLQLPSLTVKDRQDLEFGLTQGVDWVCLSFVRQAADVALLKQLIAELMPEGEQVKVIAKIEKPQAIANLTEILAVVDGVMVARGDLGVELPPEQVPMIQKRIIRECNQLGIPVITATQMLESMIYNPRPTRAEASDVANAILDGTDAVMLSGESAVGAYPIEAVAMMARIAQEIERTATFMNYPANKTDDVHGISEALHTVTEILEFKCIVAFTASGYTAILASKERTKIPLLALTPSLRVFHRLNLVWGVQPVWLEQEVTSFEQMLQQAEHSVLTKKIATAGDRILIVGGIPMGQQGGTNFLKIHRLGTVNLT